MRESLYYLVGVCAGLVLGTMQGFVWGFALRPMWDDWLSGLFHRLTRRFAPPESGTP